MYPWVTWFILAVTAVATLAAFRNPRLRERWMFDPQAVLAEKQYERMLTSGFIHADWLHFFFNAFSFYNFASLIEVLYGPKTLVLIYLVSILGGAALSLWVHRHHEYRALGASGGVCGVIFASIFLLPGNSLTVFPFPFPIPALVYALAFLVGSFFALRRQIGNIGHDAHLGGAILGLLVATGLYPQLIFAAPWTFALVLGVSLAIMLLLIFDPLHLWLQSGQVFSKKSTPAEYAGDDRSRRYQSNQRRNENLAEIDRLLEKVSKSGMGSLSSAEKNRLEQLSQAVYGRKRE
jgi:membrane associated rhomboid family serine protease